MDDGFSKAKRWHSAPSGAFVDLMKVADVQRDGAGQKLELSGVDFHTDTTISELSDDCGVVVSYCPRTDPQSSDEGTPQFAPAIKACSAPAHMHYPAGNDASDDESDDDILPENSDFFQPEVPTLSGESSSIDSSVEWYHPSSAVIQIVPPLHRKRKSGAQSLTVARHGEEQRDSVT